jgi:hypothetical protein
MDIHLLVAERKRVADEFRSTLTCLAILRAQLTRSLTDEARQHLLAVIGEKVAQSRKLSEKLLEADAAILKMQTFEAALRSSQVVRRHSPA